jgi:hypothetical protein
MYDLVCMQSVTQGSKAFMDSCLVSPQRLEFIHLCLYIVVGTKGIVYELPDTACSHRAATNVAAHSSTLSCNLFDFRCEET